MKNIDVKSLLIGILLATTVIFGIGATSPTDNSEPNCQQRPDPPEGPAYLKYLETLRNQQQGGPTTTQTQGNRFVQGGNDQLWTIWTVKDFFLADSSEWAKKARGGEPFAVQGNNIVFRKRIR